MDNDNPLSEYVSWVRRTIADIWAVPIGQDYEHEGPIYFFLTVGGLIGAISGLVWLGSESRESGERYLVIQYIIAALVFGGIGAGVGSLLGGGLIAVWRGIRTFLVLVGPPALLLVALWMLIGFVRFLFSPV